MSAIGASIGYFFTSAATLVTMRRDSDGSRRGQALAVTGIVFSVIFMILQLIPIPGLNGVHFGKESYIMLLVWVILGFALLPQPPRQDPINVFYLERALFLAKAPLSRRESCGKILAVNVRFN